MEDTHAPGTSRPARRVTAADIPPELHWNILRYVIAFGGDRFLPSVYLRGQLNCSLVCVYWAQQIRQSVYDKRRVWIFTEKQAKDLRKLVVHRGSERLTPIVDMIADIEVWHDADSRSWHHILLCLIPRIPPHKFWKLYIYAYGDRSVGPRSPHWDVPMRLSSFTTPYRRLDLSYLRFPSLHALVTLPRQFPCLEELNISDLTWNDNDMHAPAHALPSTTPQRKHPLLSNITVGYCTDKTLLFLHLSLLRPYGLSLLNTLSDEDQGALAKTINGVARSQDIALTVVALSGK